MKKTRIGVIGCGGRQNCHLDSFVAMDDVEVVAVADLHEDRRLAAAKKTGAQRIYKDHTELLDNEGPDTMDAVYIAVEPTAHHQMETRIIDMGLPFFVEKPMSNELSEAEEICRLVEEKGIMTSVGFQDRYLDLIDIIKAELPHHKQGFLVNGAWIGGIPGVWWWQKKSTCGGQLVEQNIHIADGLRWLFGDPLSVYAVNARGIVRPGIDASPEYDTDDYSVCIYRFPNNVTATLESGCYMQGANAISGMVIKTADMIFDYRLRNNLILSSADKTVDIPRKNDQTFDLDRGFITAVQTGDPATIRSSYADAMKTLRMTFAANRSMETGEVIHFDKLCRF